MTAEGNTNDGRNCAEGQTADCNGDCFNSQTLESFIGDGFCDDGTYGMVLVCLEHNCDGGDCNNGDASADCSGQCGGNHFIDSCDECVLELVDGDVARAFFYSEMYYQALQLEMEKDIAAFRRVIEEKDHLKEMVNPSPRP